MAEKIIKKDREVSVKMKNGGEYKYSYSTLVEITKHLEENKQRYTAFVKKIEGDDYMFIQKLVQGKDGSWVKDDEPLQGAKIPPVQGIQNYAGVLTAVRRISLLMVYGLACEETETGDDPVPPENAKEKWKKMHTPSPNNPVSEKQRAAIRNLCERLGKSSAEALALIQELKSAADASKLITALGEKVAEKAVL